MLQDKFAPLDKEAHTHHSPPITHIVFPLGAAPSTEIDTDRKRFHHILEGGGGVGGGAPGAEVHSAAARPSDHVCLWVVLHVAMQLPATLACAFVCGSDGCRAGS